MIDFNDQAQVARIRKQFSSLGTDAIEYLEHSINSLDTLTGITKIKEVEGRREAMRILKTILGFIK